MHIKALNPGLLRALRVECPPHLGHVSNFCYPVGPMIEPRVARSFESDPCELLARVHGRRPVWTRLELANGAQDNFLLVRDSLGMARSLSRRVHGRGIPEGCNRWGIGGNDGSLECDVNWRSTITEAVTQVLRGRALTSQRSRRTGLALSQPSI